MGMRKLENSNNLVYTPTLPSGKSTILSPRPGNYECKSSVMPYSEVNSSRYSWEMVDMAVSSCIVSLIIFNQFNEEVLCTNLLCIVGCLTRVPTFVLDGSDKEVGGGSDGEGGLERFSRGVIGDNDRVIILKKKALKVVEGLKVKFEVLIEKKKMYYLGLRRFDLWMEFLMVHLEELEMKKWWGATVTRNGGGDGFLVVAGKGCYKRQVFDGAFRGVGDEEVVVGEGVVVTSSSLEMLTNSCLGGIMVNLIFLEGFEEEAFVEFMVDFG
ncbi:hypothetical protein Tco_0251779 [Tanacetum coccineum]